ncbi:hypothetical protein KC960_02645 [Candidatus Saccharibacteria bacterium]|nr:hypothetical protein [Candidatus Saccharibacteria bacterium]
MKINQLAGVQETLLVREYTGFDDLYNSVNSLHIGVRESLILGGGFPRGWKMPGGSKIDFTLRHPDMTEHNLSLVVATLINRLDEANPLMDVGGNETVQPKPDEYSVSMRGMRLNPETFLPLKLPSLHLQISRVPQEEIELDIFRDPESTGTILDDPNWQPDILPVSMEEEVRLALGYVIDTLSQFTLAQTGNGLATLTTRLQLESRISPSTPALEK